MKTIMTNETKEVLTKARENHWRFGVVGEGGMISAPMYQDGWWYMPMEKPDNIICRKHYQRIKLVTQIAGFQGLIVAHESPKMFGPAKKTWSPPKPYKVSPLKVGRIQEMPDVQIDWQAVGQAAKAVGKVTLVVVVGTLYFLAMAASVFAQVDPSVIVVTEDGTWIEVVKWYE